MVWSIGISIEWFVLRWARLLTDEPTMVDEIRSNLQHSTDENKNQLNTSHKWSPMNSLELLTGIMHNAIRDGAMAVHVEGGNEQNIVRTYFCRSGGNSNRKLEWNEEPFFIDIDALVYIKHVSRICRLDGNATTGRVTYIKQQSAHTATTMKNVNGGITIYLHPFYPDSAEFGNAEQPPFLSIT